MHTIPWMPFDIYRSSVLHFATRTLQQWRATRETSGISISSGWAQRAACIFRLHIKLRKFCSLLTMCGVVSELRCVHNEWRKVYSNVILAVCFCFFRSFILRRSFVVALEYRKHSINTCKNPVKTRLKDLNAVWICVSRKFCVGIVVVGCVCGCVLVRFRRCCANKQWQQFTQNANRRRRTNYFSLKHTLHTSKALHVWYLCEQMTTCSSFAYM